MAKEHRGSCPQASVRGREKLKFHTAQLTRDFSEIFQACDALLQDYMHIYPPHKCIY